MSEFEAAIGNVVDILLALGVDEPEFGDAVTGLGLAQYADLHTANENKRELRIKGVLRSLRQRGWLDQFEDPLRELRPLDADFQRAVDGLFEAIWVRRDGWYKTPDPPWKSHVVEDGGIVDREQLRQSVELMLNQVGPKRVLLISGDGELGKTYSKLLLRVVAARRAQPLAEVDLKYWDTDGEEARIQLVAESLAQQLGLTLPRAQQHTTVKQQAKSAATALANEIKARMPGNVPWLFIDHLDTSSADRTEIDPFIHSLAYLAAEEKRNYRLVVVARKLSLQEALGRPAARRALEEQVRTIEDSDIESYFLDLAAYLSKSGVFNSDAANDACKEVWNRAGGQGQVFDLPACLWEVAKERLSQ